MLVVLRTCSVKQTWCLLSLSSRLAVDTNIEDVVAGVGVVDRNAGFVQQFGHFVANLLFSLTY